MYNDLDECRQVGREGGKMEYGQYTHQVFLCQNFQQRDEVVSIAQVNEQVQNLTLGLQHATHLSS